MIDDADHECPGGCGDSPAWGCRCTDDGEQYRVPKSQWPDGDRCHRPVNLSTGKKAA